MSGQAKAIEPEEMDEEAHRAWIASLSDDDLQVLHVPVGHKYTLIGAALAKRALQTKGISVGAKLRLLELLNGSTDQYFTPAMLAMIQPMSDTEFAIYNEAASLDSEGHCDASFEILTSWRVFDHFLKLNPSIREAIKYRAERPGAPPIAGGEPERATETAKLANGEIPARFFRRTSRPEVARGTPNHPAGGIDPHTGMEPSR